MPKLPQIHLPKSFPRSPSLRHSSTKPPPLDITALLREPTWSVQSLLPDPASTPEASQTITLKDLQHLSALSALPVPADPNPSLRALQSHLHFVSTVRSADTTGVPPLQSLRDETAQGEKAAEFGMRELRKALEGEEVVGKFHRRIRRRKTTTGSVAAETAPGLEKNGGGDWDVLGMAERRVGRYFVVDRVVKAREEGEGG